MIVKLSTHETWGSAAAGKLSSQLGVLFGDLDLCSGGFGVREGVDDFSFCAGELGGALKILEGFGHLVLLQEKLCHGSHGYVALRIDF